MQAQMAAHRATVDSLRTQADQMRRADLDKQRQELEEEKGEKRGTVNEIFQGKCCCDILLNSSILRRKQILVAFLWPPSDC